MNTFDLVRAGRTYEVIHNIISEKKENRFTVYPKQLRKHPISEILTQLEGKSVFSGILKHH